MPRLRNDGVEYCGDQGSMGETRFAQRVAKISAVIDENVSVSMKVIIPVCSAIMFSTWLISQNLSKLERRLEEAWYIGDMERWSREFRRLNPNINLPDAREIYDLNTERKIKLSR